MRQIGISKLLIANRGEIACRIIKTAQAMGIECVAVYSDADKNAQHVKLANEAYYVGGSAAKDSYLKTDKIIEVAKQANADAVHPGYGFLSENASFAKQCAANNIVFVGPPVEAIVAMGSKSTAKSIMQKAGVPLVEGYHGEDQSEATLQAEADKIGYPLLIKATAGGGGKGMRVVEKSKDFIEALNSCKRESISSFGDDRVLIEKYLTKPRHVEIQVFADSHNNAVHLFERDCSVQRRHQKVIEEAPAPGLSEVNRQKMGAVAIKAAQAIGYQGAGTVEFLYDEDGSFYFMEMNTRLQVEHPVTEMITGLDLVEWQIMVANGLALPKQQSQISMTGHAFEARIYAEDPSNDFLPATGQIHHLGLPKINQNVRVDSGIISGDSVSVYYDPMIAKLIVWDHNRDAALARLRGALKNFHVAGVTTNIEFLHQLASNDAFINADLDTHFLEKHDEELLVYNDQIDHSLLAAAALKVLLNQMQLNQYGCIDSRSPWNDNSGWRLNEDNHHAMELIYAGQTYPIIAHFREHGFIFEIENNEYRVSGNLSFDEQAQAKLHLNINGHQHVLNIAENANRMVIFKNAKNWEIEIVDHSQVELGQDSQANLTAPMPGTIIDVLVSAGDSVEQGQALIVMEAMKMEHTIKAHQDAVVADVFYKVGDLVEDGAELITFEEE
ncbi:acetyl/propionyl/methylcrotonyl-CoA carboxylase subunit alpha [Aliikangiella sp. IMCC44653]